MRSIKNLLIVFLLISNLVIFADIINIPDDQPTIQAGINVALEHDTVLVQPGIYYENIDYTGKNVVVGSLFFITQDTSYISQTVIDGTNSSNVVKFKNGESGAAVLCGFTITNGLAELFWNYNYGGGIICANSEPTISYCVITGNSAYPVGKGGGVFCGASNAAFRNVTIKNNFATDTGGGIQINETSHIILENVVISNNIATWGGGIYIYGNCNPLLTKVEITDNIAFSEGGGIICYINCNPILQYLTVSGNYSPSGAGIFVGLNCAPEILNSIFWNNNPQEIYLSGGSITITYSNIQGGWAGTGNINEDPLFIDPFNYNFHLLEDSPCIDAGDPNSPPDPDGTVADMGAYYFDQLVGTENNFVNFANEFGLYQNYPNPFNPSGAGRSPTTTISFSLNTENTEDTELIIYNIKGQKIRQYSIFNPSNAGQVSQSSITWDGKDEYGESVSTGFYLYKIETESFTAMKKMLLIK